MTTDTIFLGYRVEKAPTNTGADLQTAYYLCAPSGARLHLVRTVGSPDILFALRPQDSRVVPIHGYFRFTDRDGTLRPVS